MQTLLYPSCPACSWITFMKSGVDVKTMRVKKYSMVFAKISKQRKIMTGLSLACYAIDQCK